VVNVGLIWGALAIISNILTLVFGCVLQDMDKVPIQ